MQHFSKTRITIVAAVIAFAAMYATHRQMTSMPVHADIAPYLKHLEAASRERVTSLSGLTPCDASAQAWLDRGRRLATLHAPFLPQSVVVIAPTFSDIHVMAVSSDAVASFHLQGTTAFGPDFVTGKAVRPNRVPVPELSQHLRDRFVAAISRHVVNANTYRRLGHDGVTIYFGYGIEHCAYVWSPHPDSVAGLLGYASINLSSGAHTATAFQEILQRLEELEARYE